MEHTTQISNVFDLSEYRNKKNRGIEQAKQQHPTNHNPDKSNRTK